MVRDKKKAVNIWLNYLQDKNIIYKESFAQIANTKVFNFFFFFFFFSV